MLLITNKYLIGQIVDLNDKPFINDYYDIELNSIDSNIDVPCENDCLLLTDEEFFFLVNFFFYNVEKCYPLFIFDIFFMKYIYFNKNKIAFKKMPTFWASNVFSLKISKFNTYSLGNLVHLSFNTDFNKLDLPLKIKKLLSQSNIFSVRQYCHEVASHKYFFLKYFNSKIKNDTFLLRQRWFLNYNDINTSVWDFFYSSIKFQNWHAPSDFFTQLNLAQEKYITIYNLHKSPIWKMRTARYAHWNLRTFGKLNEYRYNKLLSREICTVFNNKTSYFFLFILLRAFTCILSWKQTSLLISYKLILVNGIPCINYALNKGDIVELPFKILFKQSNYELSNKFWDKLIGKIKKTAYQAFLKQTNKHTEPQKLNLKILKKAPLGYSHFGAITAFDHSINALVFVYNVNQLQSQGDYEFLKSSVLTLQNWRYRFD